MAESCSSKKSIIQVPREAAYSVNFRLVCLDECSKHPLFGTMWIIVAYLTATLIFCFSEPTATLVVADLLLDILLLVGNGLALAGDDGGGRRSPVLGLVIMLWSRWLCSIASSASSSSEELPAVEGSWLPFAFHLFCCGVFPFLFFAVGALLVPVV